MPVHSTQEKVMITRPPIEKWLKTPNVHFSTKKEKKLCEYILEQEQLSNIDYAKMDLVTVYDFETTGLFKAEGTEDLYQPHATEFYGMQFDQTTDEVINEFETYIKPPIPIPAFLEKQIGITNEMVANAPTFIEVWRNIVAVFLGSHTSVAHNHTFDERVLSHELRRIGKEYHCPYPPTKFCTVEQSMWVKGYRLKNGELYEIATGKVLEGAHIARNDVMATYENYKWLKEQEAKNDH